MVNRLNGNQTKIIRRTSCRQNGIRHFLDDTKVTEGALGKLGLDQVAIHFPAEARFRSGTGYFGATRLGTKREKILLTRETHTVRAGEIKTQAGGREIL